MAKITPDIMIGQIAAHLREVNQLVDDLKDKYDIRILGTSTGHNMMGYWNCNACAHIVLKDSDISIEDLAAKFESRTFEEEWAGGAIVKSFDYGGFRVFELFTKDEIENDHRE